LDCGVVAGVGGAIISAELGHMMAMAGIIKLGHKESDYGRD
jgi:hypothetical protein